MERVIQKADDFGPRKAICQGIAHLKMITGLRLELAALAALSLCAAASLSSQNSTAALLLVVLCATLSLFPIRRILVLWPFGLALVILMSYSAYALMWILNRPGLDLNKAQVIIGIQILGCWFIWLMRRQPWKKQKPQLLNSNLRAEIAISLLTISLFALVLFRFSSSPTTVVADHLAGGDHGIHLQYINGLISGAGVDSYTSPFSIQDYPKGIHFVIALFYSLSDSRALMDRLFDLHLYAAFFEHVQMIAFVTLLFAAVLLADCYRKLRLHHVVYGIMSIAVLFSIPRLFHHFFWSGFTTSLALAWILLLPLTWSVTQKWKSAHLDFLHEIARWGIIAILVWIVYQPYLIIPMSLIMGRMVIYLGYLIGLKVSVNMTFLGRFVPFLFGFSIPLVYLAIFGSSSESIRRLTLFGVSWRISQVLLYATLIAVAGILSLALWKRVTSQTLHSDVMYLSCIIGFTMSFAIIATVSSPFTFFNQPYYVQKMFWTLFVVSFVIGIRWTLVLMLKLEQHLSSRNARIVQSVPFALLLPLLIIGARPADISERISIGWFAEGMQTEVDGVEPFRAAAFNTWENLGAHVGNIALREVSETYLTVDIAQSRNSYWACWYMRLIGVNLVYTATGQGAALLEAGCDPFITYVENDTKYESLIAPTPEMITERRLSAVDGGSGRKFFVHGFFDRSDSGRWGHGFASTIQMISTVDSQLSKLRLNFSEQRNRQLPMQASFHLDGVLIDRQELSRENLNIEVNLPEIKSGQLLTVQLDCLRSEQQVLEASQDEDKLKCFEIRDFSIVTLS